MRTTPRHWLRLGSWTGGVRGLLSVGGSRIGSERELFFGARRSIRSERDDMIQREVIRPASSLRGCTWAFVRVLESERQMAGLSDGCDLRRSATRS